MAIEEDPPEGVPDWVVTFGDMMSLLLTFFIMLVSMSEVKQDEKYQALVESMRRQFGHDMSMASTSPGRVRPRKTANAPLATMGRAQRANTEQGGDRTKAPVGEHSKVRTVRPGDQSVSGGMIFFDSVTSELTEEHRRRLQTAAEVLGGKPQKIEVRGHTSSQPLPEGSRYEDHWDLAYARCRVVMQFMVSLGIDPARIRMSVAAHYEPLHISDDPMLVRKNSRVDVFMLDELTSAFEGTAEEQRQRYSPEITTPDS